MSIIQQYYHWLHGRWPDRAVEKTPLVNTDGTTNIALVSQVEINRNTSAIIKKYSLLASPVHMAEKFAKDGQFIEVKNV